MFLVTFISLSEFEITNYSSKGKFTDGGGAKYSNISNLHLKEVNVIMSHRLIKVNERQLHYHKSENTISSFLIGLFHINIHETFFQH